MVERVVLDLRTLHEEVEMSRPVVQALALAASVVLERFHGPRDSDPVAIRGEETYRAGEILRVIVDDRARASYADPQEATEEAAEAIAIAVAQCVFNRVVFARLPKGTGADYRMREREAPDGDSYERLECSGIGDGTEAASARLSAKIEQLARYPHEGPGSAVVTSFRMKPVDVRVGSYQP